MVDNQIRILFACDAGVNVAGLVNRMQPALTDHYQVVNTPQQYEDLADQKYSFDCITVLYGGVFVQDVLTDQAKNSQRCKWVHSLSAGIDNYVQSTAFVESQIPLTNVKGAFSHVLGEFIALGMLYHSKKLESFMQKKAESKWEIEPVDLCSKKTMLIVGFGDIGAACGKVCKNGFGTRVIGLKRRPEATSDEHRACCDELVSLDKLDEYLPKVDYVVGVLPKTPQTTHFFSMEKVFSKMKSSAVFMNIGRGPTCKEEDLIEALKTNKIAGAVLDVFEKEPLTPSNELWKLPNVLMTPHCADQDPEYLDRAMQIFAENISLFKTGKELRNVCDKQAGY